MHRHRTVILAGLALAFWGASIGSRAVTAAPATTPAAASAPVAAPPPASPPAAAATDFDGRLRDVEAAAADTDFAKAVRLCQAMIADFKTGDQVKTLGETLHRLTDGRKAAAKLAFAVQKLGASDVQARQAGAQVLEDEGDLGGLFLRHAFRTKEEPIAREAGRILAKLGDTSSIPLFLDKLKADPRSPLAEVASQGLVFMAQTMDKSVVASCFGLVQSDKGFVMARVVDVLEAVFLRECKRDEKAFNEAAGHPDASNVLRDYFSAALLSTNPAVVAWACERVRDMLPMRDGFRARYYPNTEFKGVSVDRMESAVRLDLDRSLLTGGRSNDISVRWTSDVLVRQAGDHTVGLQAYLSSSVRMWVDDRLVLELTPPGVPAADAPVTLEPGWHKLRIDYVKQTGGINAGDIGFSWAGPKIEGAQGAQVPQSPAAAFMHGPWPEEVAAMAKAATDLGAKDYPAVKAARQRLAAAASLGRVFLLNASGKQAGAARRQATDGLCDQVRQIESRRFPALYNLALAAEAEPVNPCVAILCSALWQNCNSDPEQFNTLVGAPDGYAKLKAHVEAALISNDKAVVARACRDGSPFAPALPGLYARYFADPNFSQLTTERLDAQIEVGKPQYPVPPDRQGRVSIEWSGWLVVDKTTTNTFGPDARGQSAGFSVDGIGVGGNTAMRLAAGRHACRVEFYQGDTNAESSIRFYWDVPVAGRRLVGPFNCAPWDSRLDALGRSAADLASGDTTRIRTAREVLRDSAGVGLVYLRNAIRYGAAPEASAAAIFLGGTRDKDAPPVLLARLKEEKDAAAIVALTDALGALAGVIDPKAFPGLYKDALADGAGEMNPYASILCAALWRVCGSDATKFGALVGDAEGYAKLETHVKAALASKDQAAATRACRNGYPLAPLMPGLRGRYYNDTNFVDLAKERLDAQINVANRQFPLPTNRQDNISAEWSGFLVIDKPGVYAFAPDARSWAAFFVGELPVSGNKMTLTSGVYTIRGSFVQNQPGGDSLVSLGWSGPGFPAQPLAGALRCVPWDGKLAELVKAVTDLASPKVLAARAARTALTEAGDVGLAYARNAVRHGAAPEASAAATFLGGTRDKDAPPVLLARLKEEKDAAAIVALTDALGALAGVIAPKVFPELYKAGLADGAAEMNPYVTILCSALWRVCSNAPAAFGQLVGDPAAHARLESHVKAALGSKDGAAVARACRNGYPLAPLLPGLRGRYFDDPEFLKLAQERLDGRLEVGNRQFPLPTNRQDNISVEWSGVFSVAQAGDFTFFASAENYAGVYVDERLVNPGNWAQPAKVTLAPGLHTFRTLFVQNQPGRPSSVSVSWEGPGVVRQAVAAGTFQYPPWDGKLAELGKAVADLATADPAKVGGAREALANAGEVGRVYLRNAVRDATAPVATAAATLLTEYRDKPAVAVMAAQFAIEKDAGFSAALLDNLCEMAGAIDSKALTDVYRTALAQDAAAMNPQVRILCAALVAFGSSPEAFNKLVNDSNGYASLQKHVQAALASASPETVRAACRYGAPFAPALPGFLGRYYRGQDFRDLALEKLDPQINVPNRQFPYADGRQDNISARWTGLLRIEKPGDYTFIVNAYGGANVWVDDQHVAASAGWGEQKKDAVKLSPGVHKVRVDMWQASGNNQVQLQWVPPGGARVWIPASLLMSAPSDATLTQVEKAVTGLSSAKPEEVGAAAEALTRHGALSLFFLRRAVRSAPLAGVGLYVPPMVAMNDLSLTNLVQELRKTQPPVAATINLALESLAAKPDRRYAPWFYAVMKADGALEFPVSGKFLSKALQEVCGNNEGRFNSEFAGGDAQGAASLKAYLGKLPKEHKP